VKKCQQKLEQRIARYNEENEIHLSAAWGHAFFNPETDHGLSEIVKRADGMLYAMKRAMKQAYGVVFLLGRVMEFQADIKRASIKGTRENLQN